MNIQSVCVASLVVWLSPAAYGEIPTIDGLFTDWSDQSVVANDAQGDASGAFDITKVAATTNGTELYLHFDTGSELNIQSGDETEGTLRLVIDLPHARQLTIDFRAKTATLNTEPVQMLPWSRLGFVCLPTYASDRYELRLNLENLGLQEGDAIKLNFAGSDGLEQDVPVVFKKAQPRQSQATLTRNSTADIRIANLNTLHQGLSDAGRSASIKRLIAAAQADVFCFQEEWDEVKFREAVALAMPSEEQVNLHWFAGCGVVTSLPAEPLAMNHVPGAAVALTLPGPKYLVVVALHLKCCGFAGSEADRTRVHQAQRFVNEIRRLRNGEFGEHLREAAVVIIGDYNLVGSRKPLDTLKTAGLTDWVLPGMADDAAYTWRRTRQEDPFWPGRLDIVCYDPTRLKQTNGCIVDTSRMSEQTLWDLRLFSHDSWASDHLLIVADFQLAE